VNDGDVFFGVLVKSYKPAKTSGLHGDLHIHAVEGQGIDTSLHVQCSKKLSTYPEGTVFRLKKVTVLSREGKGQFLTSHFGWPFDVVPMPAEAD